MNQKQYRSMMDHFHLSEECDAAILQKMRSARPSKTHVVRKVLIAAAVIAALLTVTTAAWLLKSDAFQTALGGNVSQWESDISDAVFTQITTEHFDVAIRHTLFTASSVNYVAAISAKGTSIDPAECLFDFDLSLTRQDGTTVEFGENVYTEVLPEDAEGAARIAVSFLLDTTEITEGMTAEFHVTAYEKFVGADGSEEPGVLLDRGVSRAEIVQVDRSRLLLEVGTTYLEQVEITPVSLIFHGSGRAVAEQHRLGEEIRTLELVFANGSTTVVLDRDGSGSIRGAIGNVTPERVTYFIGMQAVNLPELTGLRLNGKLYAVEQ